MVVRCAHRESLFGPRASCDELTECHSIKLLLVHCSNIDTGLVQINPMKFFGIFVAMLFAGIPLLSYPAYAACNINNNSGDDYVIICNTTPSSLPDRRGRRFNIQTFSTVRVQSTVTQNTGFNNIIAGEDNVNPVIVTGNASSSIQQIIRVGNVRINFSGNPPIFPE